jgi:LPS-assembly lipoprotein
MLHVTWKPVRRGFAAMAVALLVAGCGFHLVGKRPLPESLQSLYIDAQAPYRVSEPPLEVALRSRLRRRGATVTSSAAAAHAVLRLTELRERRDVLSVGADGKALEFQLTTEVTYVLMQGDRILVPANRLSATRDYSFNAQEILAKEAEEARLQRFLQDELAELMLLRLEAALAANDRAAAHEGAAQ